MKFLEEEKETIVNAVIYFNLQFNDIDNLNCALMLDNYDIDTIVSHVELTINEENKDKVFNYLREIKKRDKDASATLRMDWVNKEWINTAISIIGENVNVRPIKTANGAYNEYDYKEIFSKDRTLDVFASSTNDVVDKYGDIKSLSPFEKFIACYIITTHFKSYVKEGPNDGIDKSRSVYEIINSDDPKIVCAGYVNLINELLHRVNDENIKSICWGCHANSQNEFGTHDNHARIMTYINDPKYKINGVFMSDPTWDAIVSDNLNEPNYKIGHMLMSRSVTETKDPDEFSDIKNDLHLDVSIHYDGLPISNISENTIPKECYVNALIAINHFLDKNMRMPKDYIVGSGISEEEYFDALRLCDSSHHELVDFASKYSKNCFENISTKDIFSTLVSANYGAFSNIKDIKDYNVLKHVVARDKYVDSVDSILLDYFPKCEDGNYFMGSNRKIIVCIPIDDSSVEQMSIIEKIIGENPDVKIFVRDSLLHVRFNYEQIIDMNASLKDNVRYSSEKIITMLKDLSKVKINEEVNHQTRD